MMTVIIAWLTVLNLAAYLAFAVDKRRAVRGDRRVPEADLLTLSIAGGTLGAYAARHRFRHKTRKQPFCTRLHLIAMVQAGLAAGMGWVYLTA